MAARFDPYHDNVFTLLEAGTHDKFKAKIAGAYGGRETPALEPGINDQGLEHPDDFPQRHDSSSPRCSGVKLSVCFDDAAG